MVTFRSSSTRRITSFMLSSASICAFLATPLVFAEADESQAQSKLESEVEGFLQEFEANPSTVMNRIPVKNRLQGGSTVRSPRFSAESIRNRDFVTQKDEFRQKHCTVKNGIRNCLKDVLPGRAAIQGNDLVENLVDNGPEAVRTLEQMENDKKKKAELATAAWSDNYWPIYQGGLGARYADPENPPGTDWMSNFTYAKENDFLKILSFAPRASSIDYLSPSEKYDLLIGDTEGTLTRTMWQEGQGYYDRDKKVEEWMGICHGWAPAAYMLPRPASKITLTAADGKTKINFFPSDIKALGSLLWAKASPPSIRFIGGRCNTKEPTLTKEGRIKDPDCFDTNPGTWHMAIVNQLGYSGRSMVMDATFDYEVWNQPVHSYSYTYFNPETKKATRTWKRAQAFLENGTFKNNKFKKRSKDAVSVVGVAMDVTYVVETVPTHETKDSDTLDARNRVRYVYDLELNKDGEIVGGEWYTNAHPDFLWTPPADAKAVSVGDAFAKGKWNGNGPVPESYLEAGRRASHYGQPLAKVVQVLFERSVEASLER